MICPVCNHDMYDRYYLGGRFYVCKSCGKIIADTKYDIRYRCPVCHNPHNGYCYTCGVHVRP